MCFFPLKNTRRKSFLVFRKIFLSNLVHSTMTSETSLAEEKDEATGQHSCKTQDTERVETDQIIMENTIQDLFVPKRGLTIVTAAVFMVEVIMGSGVLALPSGVRDAGWVGIALIVLCCFLSMYTGDILGKCWCLVQERYPEFRGHVRYPYPAMGQITYGKPGRLLVSFSINFTLFGVAVVFLLLASQNIHDLINYLNKDISLCYWLIIVAGLLALMCLFGTSADFPFVGIGAMAAMSIAIVMVFVNILLDKRDQNHVTHSLPEVNSFFMALGTICFAFSGHTVFPTFQADTRDHKQFGKAMLLAYIVLVMYLPVVIAAYVVYGDSIDANILETVSSGPMLYTVQILFTVQLVLGFIIVLNPFSQEVEELLKIPKEFNWKRCVSRTITVGLVLFVAESIPHFGAILALVGGSTISLLGYVFPSIFYMKLCRMNGEWDTVCIPLHTKVANYVIVVVGLVAGAAATYSAISGLASPDVFSLPYYMDI
ncbi:amino acid transporter AVT1D-like isoform X2 [Gigantopelta aegis]|uniref:amino acid transporter AVT1D-like isoform X2 n=1 Tax=Gigantopelta aegis TaxID=1735272 RepID=UPI001B889341|nr:amino acid transporter AVT1D-like isoform X2 [Gigantopelta aegis]